MPKIEYLFRSLIQANEQLKKAIFVDNPDSIVRDATIQRFEFTFELSWKCMEVIAQDQDRSISGAKPSIRFMAEIGLLSDPLEWFKYHEFRNRLSHIYSEKMAIDLYNQIRNFYKLTDEFIANTEKYLA